MNRWQHDNLDKPQRQMFRTSIHPFGRHGSNMCGSPNRAVTERKFRGREDHCERHPNDAVAAAHLAKLRLR